MDPATPRGLIAHNMLGGTVSSLYSMNDTYFINPVKEGNMFDIGINVIEDFGGDDTLRFGRGVSADQFSIHYRGDHLILESKRDTRGNPLYFRGSVTIKK